MPSKVPIVVICILMSKSSTISGIKNPIRLAKAILQIQREPQPLGRVPPLSVLRAFSSIREWILILRINRTLASQGASLFAAERGLNMIDPASLISAKAHSEWAKWKARLQNATPSADSSSLPNGQSHLEDTVGAIACDEAGDLAAGVSRSSCCSLNFLCQIELRQGLLMVSNCSGGLLLKYPGRIGEVNSLPIPCRLSKLHASLIRQLSSGRAHMRALLSEDRSALRAASQVKRI